ncbi:hypothetical protein E1A91_D06G234700v1 [Gossypium mustelinum]|uniref:Uncharacterized protein n=1 Tax=Gossypium mustelinum TaxID=34275 RepID=A0A5D2UMR0_GOSMU|nr:hypothetical protein E1A91_D06G234700v1 [Gossypium mustelinum]
MTQPIVISARGNPPHLSATCLARFGISGWLHSTLIFFRAPILPHTSKDRVIKISLEPFSWLGFGIPTWFKSVLSHKSSNNTTNLLLHKTRRYL